MLDMPDVKGALMDSLKVIFMGTPDFSVPALGAILDAGHELAAVYSQPPSRAGRGKKQRPSPVHAFAMAHDIPVQTPKSLKNTEAQARFAAHDADIAVVAAYGLILPLEILQAPRLGCLNIHASLLPRWRGAAPIQRALMAGDSRSGVHIMQMDEGLDTGTLCLSDNLSLPEDMTAGQLHDALMTMGSKLITQALALAAIDELKCRPQPDTDITYAKKIKKSEARIKWQRSSEDVHNLIRGLSPFPGAWFEIKTPDGKTERIKLLSSQRIDETGPAGKVLSDELTIACETGAIKPRILQRAGKKPMDRETFLRGFPISPGTQLE